MNEIHIVHQPTVMNYDGLKMALLPWICPDNEKESLDFIRNCKADILGGHLELDGFDMMKGIPNTHGMDPSLFSRFEAVYSGHFHTKSTQGNITYLGSQLEFTWSDAHDNKYFHILDTNTRELTEVRNPHTVFHRIHYDDTQTNFDDYDVKQVDNKFVKIVVINKTDLFTFDRFVDRIQNRPIHELKIAENFAEFLGDAVEDEGISVEETTELLDSYIDNVETDLSKDRLKSSMRDLFTEANALEIA